MKTFANQFSFIWRYKKLGFHCSTESCSIRKKFDWFQAEVQVKARTLKLKVVWYATISPLFWQEFYKWGQEYIDIDDVLPYCLDFITQWI